MADERLRRLPGATVDDRPTRDERRQCVVRQDHYGFVRMDNSELLRRDRLDRLAEDVGVLQPDVRQQNDAGAQDVRRVVAPPEPGLDDRNVDLGVGERGERGSGDRLELCRPHSSAAGRTRRSAAESRPRCPPSRMRSAHERTWGETVAPTPSPSARSSCSIVTVAVDLPFVPTT